MHPFAEYIGRQGHVTQLGQIIGDMPFMVREAHPLMDHHHARNLALGRSGPGEVARELRGAIGVGQRLAGEDGEGGEGKGEGGGAHGTSWDGNQIL